MNEKAYATIDRDRLKQQLKATLPDHQDPHRGYALVNVLKPEAFQQEHIPGSINIPAGHEEIFEERFDKDKQIIVYCASSQCQASPTVARELSQRGFNHIVDYEGGLSDWKEGGNPVVTAQS